MAKVYYTGNINHTYEIKLNKIFTLPGIVDLYLILKTEQNKMQILRQMFY